MANLCWIGQEHLLCSTLIHSLFSPVKLNSKSVPPPKAPSNPWMSHYQRSNDSAFCLSNDNDNTHLHTQESFLLSSRQKEGSVYLCAQSLSRVQLFATPWTASLPGSSVRGILQARILEWVVMPSSRGSSQPRDQTCVSCSSCIVGRLFTHTHTCVCI